MVFHEPQPCARCIHKRQFSPIQIESVLPRMLLCVFPVVHRYQGGSDQYGTGVVLCTMPELCGGNQKECRCDDEYPGL